MIVEAITAQFNELREEFKTMFEAKSAEVSKLKSEVDTLKKKVSKLEEKAEDSEAYERRDTVVLSGQVLPTATRDENCIHLASQLIKDQLNMNLSPHEISVAHRIGRKPTGASEDRRSIIMKLCRRDTKHELLSNQRRVKPNGFFINENLTPMRNTILFALRKMRRFPDSRVKGCSSHEGKVYVWVKTSPNAGPSVRDTKIPVNSRGKLEEISENFTGKPLSHFVETWNH